MHIEVTDHQNSKRTFTFDKTKILIGRSKDADLRLESDEISRKHLYLEIENGRFFVEDLGAANGVYINGEKLASLARTEIQTFFPLQIGPNIYIQILEEPSAATPSSSRTSLSSDKTSTSVSRQRSVSSDRTVTRTVANPLNKKKAPDKSSASSKNSFLLLLVLAGAGYYAYSEYIAKKEASQVTQENIGPKELSPAQVVKAQQNVQLTPMQIHQRNLSEAEMSKLCQQEADKMLCDKLDPPLSSGEGVIVEKNVARIYRNISELQKSDWGQGFNQINKVRLYEFMMSYLLVKAMALPEVNSLQVKKVEVVDFERLTSGEVVIRAKGIISILSGLMNNPQETLNEIENMKSSGNIKVYDEKIKTGHVISYFMAPEDLLKE